MSTCFLARLYIYIYYRLAKSEDYLSVGGTRSPVKSRCFGWLREKKNVMPATRYFVFCVRVMCAFLAAALTVDTHGHQSSPFKIIKKKNVSTRRNIVQKNRIEFSISPPGLFFSFFFQEFLSRSAFVCYTLLAFLKTGKMFYRPLLTHKDGSGAVTKNALHRSRPETSPYRQSVVLLADAPFGRSRHCGASSACACSFPLLIQNGA